jgi:hypothetical protein
MHLTSHTQIIGTCGCGRCDIDQSLRDKHRKINLDVALLRKNKTRLDEFVGLVSLTSDFEDVDLFSRVINLDLEDIIEARNRVKDIVYFPFEESVARFVQTYMETELKKGLHHTTNDSKIAFDLDELYVALSSLASLELREIDYFGIDDPKELYDLIAVALERLPNDIRSSVENEIEVLLYAINYGYSHVAREHILDRLDFTANLVSQCFTPPSKNDVAQSVSEFMVE